MDSMVKEKISSSGGMRFESAEGQGFFCSHCSFLCLSFGGQCTLKGFPPFSLTPFARRNRKGQGRLQKWDKKLESLFKFVTKAKRQKAKGKNTKRGKGDQAQNDKLEYGQKRERSAVR